MVKVLTATYDGKSLVPSTPITLMENIAYLVTVQPMSETDISLLPDINDNETITERLNRVYANLSSKLDDGLAKLQWNSLSGDNW